VYDQFNILLVSKNIIDLQNEMRVLRVNYMQVLDITPSTVQLGP